MAPYVAVRAFRWAIGLLVVLFVTYAMMFYGGGDPIRRMFVDQDRQALSPEAMEAIRVRYGLDEPFLRQFVNYLERLAHGDMGVSIRENRPVTDMILARLPISLQLGIAATVVATMFGIPLGVLAALHHNRWSDTLIVGVLSLLQAVPIFVTAPVLLLFLVVGIDVINVPFGWKGLFHTQAILPVFVIALGAMPIFMRQTRAAVLGILSEDYIRTARAKGLGPRQIAFRHMLRPALSPVVTTIGLVMTTVVNGAIFVELIFNIPGLGNLTLQGVRQVDYPIIMGTVLVGAVLVMITNLFVDLMYPFLDPRVKLY
ncbi:MAG: ABC transporter permease [Chloroflexota bacterium]|nr:ABC transporter permease [Chloroflexota bacterium]